MLGVGAGAGAGRLSAADVGQAWGRGGRGQAAVCDGDEDALTLAWDAATAALEAAGVAPDTVGGLWWGCGRPPFAEGPSHTVLATALRLAPAAGGSLSSGSAHSGTDALVAAVHALAAGAVEIALVVVSDSLIPSPGTAFEARSGAGAMALVLGRDGSRRITVAGTRARPVLDRYRGDCELATRDLYDGRLFRETVFGPAIAEVAPLVAAVASPQRWSLPDPDGRMLRVAAKAAGAPLEAVGSSDVVAAVGDTGAAAAMLGALPGLADGQTTAVIAMGGGRTTAVVIETDDPVPGAAGGFGALQRGRSITYADALRNRGQLVAGGEGVAMGVPPGSAMLQREAAELLQLHGARCEECGTVATPPSVHPSCPDCGGPKLEPVELSRQGTVHTYVVNHTMPAPFQAPLPLVVVDLDDGARVQLMGDGHDDLAIGAPVELVLRRYTVERGVPIYGYKVKARRTDEGSR